MKDSQQMKELVVGEMSSDEGVTILNVKQHPELRKAVDRCTISNRDVSLIAKCSFERPKSSDSRKSY